MPMLIRTGIMTVPDYDEDAISIILSLLQSHMAILPMRMVAVQDQRNWIEETLRTWADEEELDLIITIGGTNPAPGPSGQQIVPLATTAIVERSLPGFTQCMRQHAVQQSELAWLDCGVTGIRGRTVILNLPTGAAPALLFLEPVVALIEPLLLHLQQSTLGRTLADELRITENEGNDDNRMNDESSADEESGHRSRSTSSGERRKGLDAGEFAAYLKRSQ